MGKYGISHSEIFTSILAVVQSVNRAPEFHIKYPRDFNHHLQIAAEFKAVSGMGFNNCAGAIDRILTWMNKPSEKDAKKCELSQKKMLCARKGKFGLNMQAMSDCCRQIFDLSINFGGALANCIAFEASDLFGNLGNGLLHASLSLYGDNAYLNKS
jgi:hypothetical protein